EQSRSADRRQYLRGITDRPATTRQSVQRARWTDWRHGPVGDRRIWTERKHARDSPQVYLKRSGGVCAWHASERDKLLPEQRQVEVACFDTSSCARQRSECRAYRPTSAHPDGLFAIIY